jgi:hypothetical protein
MLVEVAVPFDAFVDDCYASKFNRYFPLCQKIADTGYQCRIIVLIVGSLGNLHNRFANGLRLTGICGRRARAIAKYCSVSAMIGSRIIWKQRCKATLP